ncbi:hypothetical protein BGX23_008685 [Mortierella sp. AD031]|nr:hypothetical protein BGX23_008685 [Mortierella sp. AD031]KAG0204078.1 hypothetical protein BGX33_008716 [Mortierella sp. NVP41]
MASVEIYRSKVTELIRQADITTVSARSIRKQIEALTNTNLTPVKEQFDELVMEIYEYITDEIERSALNGGQTAQQGNGKDQQHGQNQPIHMPTTQQQQPGQSPFKGFALPPTSYVAPKPATPPVKAPRLFTPDSSQQSEDDDSDSDSDASYSSVEDDPKESRRAMQLAKNEQKKQKNAVQREEAMDDAKQRKLEKKKAERKKEKEKEKEKEREKKKKEKAKKLKQDEKKRKLKETKDTPRKKRAPALNEDGTEKVNGFNKPLIISDALYQVVGQHGQVGPSGRVEMPRTQVVKYLWQYIKENNLQNPKDGRQIICNDKMKAIFGLDEVGSFAMNKYLKDHLTKPDSVPDSGSQPSPPQ